MSSPPPPPDHGAPNTRTSDDKFQELVCQASAGDQDAARRMYDRYHGQVLQTVRRHMTVELRRFCDSADVTQATWAAVFKTLAGSLGFHAPAQFVAFLQETARLKTLEAKRFFLGRRKRSPARTGPLGEQVDPAPGPEREVDDADAWLFATGRLGPHEHAALEGLRAGEKIEALGCLFGVSVKTLRRWVWRAIRRAETARGGGGAQTRC